MTAVQTPGPDRIVCMTVIGVVMSTSCDGGHNKCGCQLIVLHGPVLCDLLQVYAIIIHTCPSTAVYTSMTNIKTCTCYTCNAGWKPCM